MSSNSSIARGKVAYGALIIGSIIPGKVVLGYIRHYAGQIPYEQIFNPLNWDEFAMSIAGRTLGYIVTQVTGHPSKWLKDASGIVISPKAPYKSLEDGDLITYALNRSYVTASTNVSAAIGVIGAKLALSTALGTAAMGTVPLLTVGAVGTAAGFASVFAATYTSIYLGRLTADVMLDVGGFRALSPNNWAKNLAEARSAGKAAPGPAMAA